MKIVELTQGIQLAIDNEEADLLGKFDQKEIRLNKFDLTEREQILANQLVNKGVLVRKNNEGKIQYFKHIDS